MNEKLFGYCPPIPTEIQEGYEKALADVLRWQDAMFPTTKEENDLEHVEDMFGIHEIDVRLECSALYAALKHHVIRPMIYIHDAGETVALDMANDSAATQEERAKWKRKEALAFHLLSAKYIEDPIVRSEARVIYDRYCEKAEDDIEANYVSLIDKIQAIRFGSKNVFPGVRLPTTALQQQKLNHTLNLVRKPFHNLIGQLSPEAIIQLKDFVRNEIDKLISTGYKPTVASKFYKEFNLEFGYSE